MNLSFRQILHIFYDFDYLNTFIASKGYGFLVLGIHLYFLRLVGKVGGGTIVTCFFPRVGKKHPNP